MFKIVAFTFQKGDIMQDGDALANQNYCFHGKYNNSTNKVELGLLICLELPAELPPRYAIFASCMYYPIES